MNASAIFPSNSLDQANILQNTNQKRRTEFQQLTQALQSSNLTNAKQAFGALTKSAASSGLESLQLAQGLNKLGSALQSGDLTGARDAYSAVHQGLQNSNPMAAHHHRPHHGGAGAGVLTSGFSESADSSAIIAGKQSDLAQPVNYTA